MRTEGANWVVVDGNGLTYTFTQDALLAGTGGPYAGSGGLWLLESIRGRGGALVTLRYDIQSVVIPDSPSPALSIDLLGFNYNPDSSAGCFKHEVGLNYEAITIGARPQSLSVIGERILARLHKLTSIDVKSRASCGAAAERLRRYALTYALDPDTQQHRLESVRVFGRQGTPEANVSLPVASYQYATATTASGGAPVLRYEQAAPSTTIPLPGTGLLAQTARIGTALFQPPVSGADSVAASVQGFADYTGDGRPDLVFAQNGTISIARGLGGMSLGPPAPLNDNTFTRPVLDVRTSELDRFSNESNLGLRNEYVWTQSIDVNGDGRIDVIDAAEQPGTWVVYLNTPGPAASGVKWVRRTYDISRIHNLFKQSGLATSSSYLPLSHRVTGRDYGEWLCFTPQNGGFVTGPPSTCPNYDPTIPPHLGSQQTFVEYEVKDLNGDGYPDVVFNSSGVGWAGEDSLPPSTQRSLGQRIYRLRPVGTAGGPNRVLAVLNVRGLFVTNATDQFSVPIELLSSSECGVGKWVGDETQRDRTQAAACAIGDVNGDGIADRFENQSFLLGTGFGFKTVRLKFPAAVPGNHRFLAVQESGFVDGCSQPGVTWSTARQTVGLRDLTGDGIPDLIESTPTGPRVFVGTGAGFAETPTAVEGGFSFSTVDERCDGSVSNTTAGLFDVNADGKPDYVKLQGSALVVYQLAGGVLPGKPEAGRIVAVDNGYGATTKISYGSAKEDSSTRHQVPFPELVITSIQTSDAKQLGGAIASTSYAYGDIELFYDSTLDLFRPTGYRRRVELVGEPGLTDAPKQTARISDRYPLDPVSASTLPFLTGAQRFGRYLRAGRMRDVTVLAGNFGTDARALLSVDVTADPRRIAGVHYSVDARETHLFSDTAAPSDDVCNDIVFPYDFGLSAANNAGTYNPCASRGFLHTGSTQSWRGTAAPPATANIQAATSVRSVDDYGRVTSIFYQNDLFRSDDDMCVDTTYAAPTNPDNPVLTAVASRKVWACGKDNTVLAQETWDYDALFPGVVSLGLPTAHTVVRYTADTGNYLGTVREFDASYDGFGNPIKIVSAREDGGKRTTQISYDPFGLSAESTAVHGTSGPALVTTQLVDPVSSEILGTKDENGTVRGTTYDGFGRPLLDTIATPDDTASGVLAARSYLGCDGTDPLGCRVSVKELTDPVRPGDVAAAQGRTSTMFFDELGRSRFGKVELGEDYAKEVMIVGARTYDSLGRVAFEADPYPASQNPATAYGTTRHFDLDGSVAVEIRGAGPQLYTTTPSAALERFPTVYRHSFANHTETKFTQGADALTPNSPQYGVTREASVTAIGRAITRSTWKSGVRLEHEALGYDQLGQLSSLVRYQDAAGVSNPVTSSWQLDSLGQLLFLNEPSSAPQARTYSDWGELKAVTWYPPSPEPTHGIVMKYDELGRLASSEERNGFDPDPATTREYRYDVAGSSPFASPRYLTGRLSSASTPKGNVVLSYDGYGRVDARTFTDDKSTTYFEQHGFHGDGSQAWIDLRLPDNSYQSERVDYAYDSAGRTRWMWFSDGSNTQELYSATKLDAWGRTRNASYGETQYAADYADLGRRLPRSVKFNSPSGARAIEYTGFDPVGRELSRGEDLPGSPGNHTQAYDALGRLQSARRRLGATTASAWTFSYDPLGNVSTLNDQLGTADATLSYLTSDRDRLCAIAYVGAPGGCNVEHDSFGSIVLEPTRTGFNSIGYFNSGDVRRIRNEAGVTATFQYDAFGDVQDLSITKGSTELRHDRQFGALISERTQKGAQASSSYLSRRFPGPGLALSRRGPTGPWIYEFGETRGNRFTTDENGRFVQDLSYTPFGKATSTGAAPGTAEFTNEQWNEGDALDAFGLVKLGKRLYDPSIGRFLSRDPLLIPRTAATSNPYAFAFNDPMNFSDPSGLDPCGMMNCVWASGGGDTITSGTAGALLGIGAWTVGLLWSGSSGPSRAAGGGWPPQTQAGALLYTFASIENGGSPAPQPEGFNWDSLALTGVSPGRVLAIVQGASPATAWGGFRAAANSVADSIALGVAIGPLIPARFARPIAMGFGGKDVIAGIYNGDAWQVVRGAAMLGLGAAGGRGGGGGASGAKPQLNLGAGGNPMAGAVNVDLRAAGGVDVIADANALPFGPGTFGEVHAINPYGFYPVSAEVARVMEAGGLLRVSGTAGNRYARPFSGEQARAAGFEVIETTPLSGVHNFGVQRTSSGGALQTGTSTTTTYRKLP